MSAQSQNAGNIVSLPKGGGAIGGTGETFTPDLFTGTATLAIPIALSPGRGGFGPKVSLHYSSGTGNGPFGLGWRLDIPNIVRGTEKGLPKYTDKDMFLLAGQEELVSDVEIRQSVRAGYRITSFSPRTEGSFSRIELWQLETDSQNQEKRSRSFWRVISNDNITSIFGATSYTTIADPEHPERIYRWCLELTYDGTGNFIHYDYKPEDGRNIQEDLKKNHNGQQLYLKRIRYGNFKSIDFSDPDVMLEYLGSKWKPEDCFFEAVFDYGEHRNRVNEDEVIDTQIYSESRDWDDRPDPFSTFRSRFEIRTYRLCRRVLMFHRIAGVSQPTLVRSTDFSYKTLEHNLITQLSSVVPRGYKPSRNDNWKYSEDYIAGKGEGLRSRVYEIASIPPLDFEYSEYEPPQSKHLIKFRGQGKEPPDGLNNPNYGLVDLFGRGMPDILWTTGEGYYYWKNLGAGKFSEQTELRVVTRGGTTGAPYGISLSKPGVGFSDLSGHCSPDIVILSAAAEWGYCKGSVSNACGWKPFKPYPKPKPPDLKLEDPYLRLIDVTGNGRLDAVRTDPTSFKVYECQGEEGFEKTEQPPTGIPPVYFDHPNVHLADMTGDGLKDIVQVLPEQIYYWPNLGFGHFGPRITLDNPVNLPFDRSVKVFFIDIDGSGPADLVSVEHGQIRFWMNRSGNGWGKTHTIGGMPGLSSGISVEVADMLGTGGTGILWSSQGGLQAYDYLPLDGARKPGLLTSIQNNMGLKTTLTYSPSTELALKAERDGRPWIGRLPFPVYVLTRVEQYDDITQRKLVTKYDYAHGYYDGRDREFRGFGRVEQFDAESFRTNTPGVLSSEVSDDAFYLPPVHTKTWFHPGATNDSNTVSRQFASEYYQGDIHAPSLKDSVLPVGLGDSEKLEALRALRGRVLRQEVYALDDSERSIHPYTVSERRYCVHRPQGKSVFSAYESELLEFYYERQPSDPRITHQFSLKVDAFDHVMESASVAYPRRSSAKPNPEQSRMLVIYSTGEYGTNTQDPRGLRHGSLVEEKSHELTGLVVPENKLLDEKNLRDQFADAIPIPFEIEPTEGMVGKRLISHSRYTYWADDGENVLQDGEVGLLALPHNTYKMVLTPGVVQKVYGARFAPDLLEKPEAGYVSRDNAWWAPSGYQKYDPKRFFQPVQDIDPFGYVTHINYDKYALLVEETKDPLGNSVKATNDYRTLKPTQLQDPNDNRQQVAYDALGVVVGTAIMGKEGEKAGDTLEDFETYLDPETVKEHLEAPLKNPHAILGKATSRIVYDLWRYYRSSKGIAGNEHIQPVVTYTLSRETHEADLEGDGKTRIQHRFLYLDGTGREIQVKVNAEPSSVESSADTMDSRWVGTGTKIYNNKGNPVRQFEPFFSDTHVFGLEQHGVSSTLFYDPLQRVVATLHPNHTYEKVVVDAWRQQTWDANDTVKLDPRTDPDVRAFFLHLPDMTAFKTWREQRIDGALGLEEQQAAQKTDKHAGTPAVVHRDSMGRTYLSEADNAEAETYKTCLDLDIKGNQRTVIDAKGRIAMRYGYDMLGNRIHQASVDAGERWALNNVAGNTIRRWDSRGHQFRVEYDALRRPTQHFVQGHDPQDANKEILFEETIYGEDQTSDTALNLRTRVFRQHDGAGVVTNESYDFKGNLHHSTRRLATEYKERPDWKAKPPLEQEIFTSTIAYDALNRPMTHITPDGSVFKATYNEANLLNTIELNLRGEQVEGQPIWTVFVRNIDYNAKGQRIRIEYGNGVRTEYEYDQDTYRLKRLWTTRTSEGDLQDFHYTYDPVGNITSIQDKAQQTIFFENTSAAPPTTYTYDAIYRLIEACGREYIGQPSSCTSAHYPELQPHYDFNDCSRVNQSYPNNGQGMRPYTEEYTYDSVGNLTRMHHMAANAAWTRHYEYASESNRLLSTSLPGDGEQAPYSAHYKYDEHGNMTLMPHLPLMHWDFEDQLQATAQLTADPRMPEMTYYLYDPSGERVRKVLESNAPTGQLLQRIKERIYLGNFEVEREYYQDNSSVKLVSEILHISDDERRIALVETRTQSNNELSSQLIRFQLSNHLDSATVELDKRAQVITYEEYYPYGSTSYQAINKDINASTKSYRYTGRERDEENGLYYYRARYYASWFIRWINPDPAQIIYGPGGSERNLIRSTNLTNYAGNNPVSFVDPHGTEEIRPRIIVGYLKTLNEQETKELGGISDPRQAKGFRAALRTAIVNLLSEQLGDKLSGETLKNIKEHAIVVDVNNALDLADEFTNAGTNLSIYLGHSLRAPNNGPVLGLQPGLNMRDPLSVSGSSSASEISEALNRKAPNPIILSCSGGLLQLTRDKKEVTALGFRGKIDLQCYYEYNKEDRKITKIRLYEVPVRNVNRR